MLELLRPNHTYGNALQELLRMTFDAERKYFETAERVQIADFSRFLYHQSIQRNQLSNMLIAAFVENNIEPDITYINKGDNKISGLALKSLLEDKKYVKHVEECMEFDNLLIEKCKEVLKYDTLPTSILEVINKELNFLVLNTFKILELINEHHKKSSNYNTKVINLNRGII